jgi:cytochrome c oxidase assembly protein subunit 15
VAQGVVGYTQYALGVPRLLVLLHVVGAALLWAVLSAAWIRARPGAPDNSQPTSPDTSGRSTHGQPPGGDGDAGRDTQVATPR